MTTTQKKKKEPLSVKVEEEQKEEVEDDRVMKDVVAPPRFPLAHNKLFRKDGSIDLEVLGEHLNKEGRLRFEDGVYLVKKAGELFKKEPNLLRLGDPLTVCGDIHGQFFDLLRLMEAGGDPADTQYLFLGDYVDRGCFSTECVFFLCAHKITYKDTFFMIRGNHECRHLTSFFNFKDECLYKYNEEMYNIIMEMFDNLPLAATVNGKFLCCHGGLSPDLEELKDIEQLDRFQEVPREGPFCDLLWADPIDEDKDQGDDIDSNKNSDDPFTADPTQWFQYNETRQCSYVFGLEAVKKFLDTNDLLGIVRAHEAQFDGYKMQMQNDKNKIPRVITIFSAPNYCDVYKNKGACLKFDDDLLNIRQFVSSPHPYYLPNFMDVFTWSLPFVAEKVTDMLYSILSYNGGEEETNNDDKGTVKVQPSKKPGVLKDKVIAVTKLMRMYKVLKDNQNNIVKLKQLSPNNKLPSGILGKGQVAIEKAISSFKEAKKADKMNEVMPTKDGTLPDPKNTKNKSKKETIFFRSKNDKNKQNTNKKN